MANKKKSNIKSVKNKKKINNFDNTPNKKNNNKDLIKNNNISKELIVEEKKSVFHENLQSFVSILFTVVIFVLLIFLIFVIYNNYLKPKENINKQELCDEYIKKDYHINKEKVLDFIKNNRHILYNIDSFNRDNFTNNDLLNISKFIIWNKEGEYIPCNGEDKCLVTKKEMNRDDVLFELSNLLQVDDLYLNILEDFNDKIRLYENNDNIVLTFSEFTYETLKHDVIDIVIDENTIKVYCALSERISNSDYYNYVGSKKIVLKYLNQNKFYLETIETNKK